ncbi:hypothetical protein K6U06_02415 [Acidiferrimicrobium sp. IK]|uniref:hypothetical protein n=1 Tax=Acidiferrimicrobium sp. IK TaxID=2871700 RepID=UPI0021CB9128|nr:hypothetical protein [Acidiferrimicrobium sp. IK]MCU4183199.1 hypothetical protein [Acidiferrimicrobium sp. IK]
MKITSHGLSVTPPPGWDASIYLRPPGPGEVTRPVLHAATVPLPAGRGDYGSGLVETLGATDVFVALLDFGTDNADTALFASTAMPGLTPDMYRPKAMQRVIAGQAGVQRFFTAGGRAFCLYSVIGSYAAAQSLCARANQVLGSLEVQAVGG